MKSLTNIRKATLEDMQGIRDLVMDLAIYEKAPEEVNTTLQDYEKNYLEGVFDAIVAEFEGKIVGMSLYYIAWSTWKGRMLYLEDFVVKESMRGHGVGKLLFDAFLQEAIARDCRLVKWQVLDWNAPAQKFYMQYKTVFDKEWWNGKIYLNAE